MNANLAEHLLPVNADVIERNAGLVPSEDRIRDPLGSNGAVAIAIGDGNRAIVNAAWNARPNKRIGCSDAP